MGKEYGVQLAIEALQLINRNPPQVVKAIDELCVGKKMDDFDTEDSLNLLELEARVQKLDIISLEESLDLKIDIGSLCQNIIKKYDKF